MSVHRQRGQMLMMQHRPKEAIEHLQRARGEDPADPVVPMLIANCHLELEDTKAALEAAQEALRLQPAWDAVHHTLARVYLRQGKAKLALESAEEAVALNPDDADNHSLRGMVLYQLSRYEDALSALETGLSMDPENVECNTLRAHTLIKLNRVPDAHDTLGTTLGRDPDNPHTHSAMGWTNLHAGNPRAAMTHFQEALRLDPTLEHARAGMIEALKSQYRVYGLFLGFMLWLNRLSATHRWGVILGIWFAQEALARVESTWPALSPVVTPVIWLLVVLCVSTWFFNPFFNGMLLFRREGRLALSGREATEGAIILGVVALSLALIGLRLYTGVSGITWISLGVLGIAILVRGLYEYRVLWQRLIWGGLSVVLILGILLVLATLASGLIRQDVDSIKLSIGLLSLYFKGLLVAVVLSWFFGNR